MNGKWKKSLALLLLATAAAALLAGCGDVAYKDGTYTARSSEYASFDEDLDAEVDGYGVVELTIRDGAIAACTFTTYQNDGTVKDGEYGKQNGEIANQDYYNKAQRAVQACDQYAQKLVETGDLKKVDAISGATINYNQFQDAVKDALSQAES